MGGAGLTNRSLSSMERGRGFDLGWLPELASALECSVTYLLGLTDNPGRWEPDTHPASTVPAQAAPAPDLPGLVAPVTEHKAHHNWILSPDIPS
jgi:hypothetical protein